MDYKMIMDYETIMDDSYFRVNAKKQMRYLNVLMNEMDLDACNAIEFMKVMFLGTIARYLDPENDDGLSAILWEIGEYIGKLAKLEDIHEEK